MKMYTRKNDFYRMIVILIYTVMPVVYSGQLLFVNNFSGFHVQNVHNNNTYSVVIPSIDHLNELETLVLQEYHSRVKRSSEFEGRRYVIYDRKPEEKKKKKKVGMNDIQTILINYLLVKEGNWLGNYSLTLRILSREQLLLV